MVAVILVKILVIGRAYRPLLVPTAARTIYLVLKTDELHRKGKTYNCDNDEDSGYAHVTIEIPPPAGALVSRIVQGADVAGVIAGLLYIALILVCFRGHAPYGKR